MKAVGDEIQFPLGHVPIETTERYRGCKQKLRYAVNADTGSNWTRGREVWPERAGGDVRSWRLLWIDPQAAREHSSRYAHLKRMLPFVLASDEFNEPHAERLTYLGKRQFVVALVIGLGRIDT